MENEVDSLYYGTKSAIEHELLNIMSETSHAFFHLFPA